jgi:EmrB/QacA subfamily drug resistance transporter
MTPFLIAYLVFSVLVLFLLNRLMRRGKKHKYNQQQPTVETANITSDTAPATTRLRTDPVQKAEPEPLPPRSERRGDTTSEPSMAEATEPQLGVAPSGALLADDAPMADIPIPAVALEAMDGEETNAEPLTDPARTRKQRDDVPVNRLLAVLLLGAFVAILNQTLINVALPHLMNDLNVATNVAQWLVTGYMLVNGVMIPITAFLIERFGTRLLFITAMILFTAGAFVCALAPSFSIMLIGRLVQASGAGIVMPLMMTVFLTIFPPEKRGKAMGTMGIAMIFAPAVGPTLSGWIVQNYTWRLLFWVVIPIGLLDLLMAYAWMVDVSKRSKIKFDLWGFLFSTLGFGGLLYAFSEAGTYGWTSVEVLGTLFIGIAFLISFVWRELAAEHPMLDLSVFRYDIFTLTTIISSIINMAMFAAMILLPVYLQNIRGFTPLESGLLLLPGAIIMGIIQPIAGAIFDKIGARMLALFGLVVTVWTTYQFSKLTADTSYGHIMLLYCLRMFGMAFMMMTIMTAGMNQLPRRLHSHGTATSNTLRTVAGSLGTALLVTIMTNRSTFHTASYASEITTTNPMLVQHLSQMGQGIAATAGLPVQYGTKVATQLLYGNVLKQSTIDGINDAFLVATGITFIALVLAFFIKRVKPPEEGDQKSS